MHERFRTQLRPSSDGHYVTSLLLNENNQKLNNIKSGSIWRLTNLLKNLKRTKRLEFYDSSIQEQRANKIILRVKVEEVNESTHEKVFYLPHRPVIRTSTETTKIRILFDVLVKANKNYLSLNDCLKAGPLLQNSLWNILIRSRLRPILLCGDIEKTFLQIRIRESERNLLRFHWGKNQEPSVIEINRFTRILFGLTQFLFILEGALKEHFDNYKYEYQNVIETIKNDMYFDDLAPKGVY